MEFWKELFSKEPIPEMDDGGSVGKERFITAQGKKTGADRKREIKESIGSLDRRVQKAVKDDKLKEAKDLRSRQKKFVKDLGYREAVDAMKAAGGKDLKIARTSDGSPLMSGAGKEVFDQIMDKYYIDPTRNLQNTNPAAYGKMYPGANFLQSALPSLMKKGMSVVNPALGILGLTMGDKNKNIPYTNMETQGLPGTEFPLGYAEALGTPEAYNLDSFAPTLDLENTVDGIQPILANTTDGYQVPEGYQVMNASSLNDGLQLLLDQGAIEPVEKSGNINLGNLFGSAQDAIRLSEDFLPNEGIFSGFNEIREGVNKLDDKKGFDFNIGDKELKYNKPMFGGDVQFQISPDQGGIFFKKELGSLGEGQGQEGTQVAELTGKQKNYMRNRLFSPDLPGAPTQDELYNRVKDREKGGFFGIGAQEPTTREEFDDYYNNLRENFYIT
jgi:hypothetical protein